jgi:hypothetical protein
MMLHPAFKELRAFASDELTSSARSRAAGHLTACQRCRDQVAWIESMQSSLRSAPRFNAPDHGWPRIQQRIAQNDIVLLPAEGNRAPARTSTRRAIVAAMLVLVLATGAAALVKRETIRQWFNARAIDLAPVPGGVVPPSSEPAAPTAATRVPVQLGIAPVDGQVLVSITTPDSALILRVRLGDQAELDLLASGGASEGRFRSAPGRLTVEAPGAGELMLTLPRSARRVTLSIDGRIVLVKERSEVRVLVRADTSGTEFILPVR